MDETEQIPTALSPQEIQAKQFPVRFRGFDVEEVDAFLEQVAEQCLMLEEENKSLRREREALRQELDTLKSEETSFKDAIISAQKVADEMKRKSREEANELLLAAQEEVKALKDEAHREVAELERRVDELRGMQTRIHDDLKAVIARYLEQMEANLAGAPPAATETGADVGEVTPPAPEISGDGEQPDQQASTDEESGDGRDLADLYEKIDLADLDTPPTEEEIMEMTGSGQEEDLPISPDDIADKLPSLDLDQEEGGAIPGEIDDVMFSLDDPLDKEDDVEVPIDSDAPPEKS